MNVPATTRRRWYQFCLRTLFIMLFVASIGLAAYKRAQDLESQRRAFREIIDSGGNFTFAVQSASGAFELHKINAPLGASWQRFLLGEFSGADHVELHMRLDVILVMSPLGGEYAGGYSTRPENPYRDPVEHTQTLKSILSLPRLDRLVVGDGIKLPAEFVQAQMAKEHVARIRTRFPTCEVVYGSP